MAVYKYRIKTTNGEADGTIEAGSEAEARKTLTDQYVPQNPGFVDADGQPAPHELVSIDLTTV